MGVPVQFTDRVKWDEPVQDSLPGKRARVFDVRRIDSLINRDSLHGIDTFAAHLADSLFVAKDSMSMDVQARMADSLSHKADSLKIEADSLSHKADSLSLKADSIKQPKKFLDAPLYGKNSDSLIYNVNQKTILVYGNGDVKYEDVGLQAAYISLNTESKLVNARGETILGNAEDGGVDSTNTTYKKPIFTKDGASYDVDSIDYNMDSQKAFIHGVRTQDGEGYLYGGEVKRMKDNVVHMHNGRYTTCDATCPHFYLQMTYGSVIPGKKTVFGPSYLVIEDVPIYFLGLPFGFFPQMSDRNSGVIIPEFGEEVVRGFFLRGGGYYLVINENVDVRLTAGIYTLGSWEANVGTNYYKRYKYQGNMMFDFSSTIKGEQGATDYENTKNYRLNWTHSQDPKASPGSTFSANVNFSTSSYNRYSTINIQDLNQTQSSSSVTYQKSWAGTPFTMGINGSLSQVMRDTTYMFNLPNINFSVARINPFKRKNIVGKERWYEKINFTYQLAISNNTGSVKEKDLFTQTMLDNMKYGAKHTIPVSASFNLMQYLNVTPNFSYTERWYFRQIHQSWDDANNKLVMDTVKKFQRVSDYNLSLNFSTALYGMYTIGKTKEKMVSIRHVMTPTFSLNYYPGFGQYYSTYRKEGSDKEIVYSPYMSELYGTPSAQKSGSISFGVNNTLEMKVPSQSDSTGFRKIKILETFSINSGYNLMAEKFKLNIFSVNMAAPILKGFTLNVNATFDPYQIDANGKRINKFQISKGSLARLTHAGTGINYTFSSKNSTSNSTGGNNKSPNNSNDAAQRANEIENGFFNQGKEISQVERARLAAGQYYNFDVPWSFNFNYTINYDKSGNNSVLRQNVMFSGNVTLTEKWAASFSAGYDISDKQFSPGAVQISRDLHCWEMSFTWVPVGYHQSWSFSIKTKSSMLADLLKWDKQNSYFDNYSR